jgi:twitching motility protein PilT
MLAESLRAVTCQHLLRTIDGKRVPAVEVMIANDAVQALIRKGKTFQIPTIIATSRDQGMQLLDTDLIRLAKTGTVLVEDAYAKANDKAAFEAALGLPSSAPTDKDQTRGPSQPTAPAVSATSSQSMPPVSSRLSPPPPSRAPRGS